MIKTLCILLSALMLLGITACGTGDETETEAPTSGERTTEAETADLRYIRDLPEDLNYQGETVHILFANKVGRDDELAGMSYGIDPEVQSGAAAVRHLRAGSGQLLRRVCGH